MALLHYRVSRFGSYWLLSCENVPIEVFPTRTLAQRGARSHIQSARSRGDTGTLEMDRKPPKPGKHRFSELREKRQSAETGTAR